MMKKYQPSWFLFPLSILILGIGAGLVSGFLSLFLEGVETLFLGWVETTQHPAALEVSPVRRLVSILLGAILVSLIWYLIRRRRKVPSVGAAIKAKSMPVGASLLHILAQIFFVGTGGSVGREVAPREAGVLLGQLWLRFLNGIGWSNLPAEDRELLLAAAAGAGFAGIYISPLTGTFFAVEILLKKISGRALTASLGMSAIATFVGGSLHGTGPYYLIGNQPFSPKFILVLLLVAPLAGLAGVWFRRGTRWAESHQAKGATILYFLPLMGLVTGLIAFFGLPQIMGNGRALTQTAFSMSSLDLKFLPLLWLAAILKGGITLLTIRSGASGGVLTPAIALGASLGAGIGLLLAPLCPGIPIWQAGLLGAVSFLAASQQAPLMALFMLVEITHLPITRLFPLALGLALSFGVSRLLLREDQK